MAMQGTKQMFTPCAFSKVSNLSPLSDGNTWQHSLCKSEVCTRTVCQYHFLIADKYKTEIHVHSCQNIH